MQQQPQPSLTEKLFKPFLDYLGLNGAAALKASHGQSQSTTPTTITADQLRKQGWTEKDISWYLATQKIGK